MDQANGNKRLTWREWHGRYYVLVETAGGHSGNLMWSCVTEGHPTKEDALGALRAMVQDLEH